VSTRTTESAVRRGEGEREREAWRVTWLLLAFMLINFADKAVLGLVAVPLQADLHLDDSKFGLIGSMFYVLFALSALVVSRLTRRYRTPVLLLVMGVVWALCQLPVVFGLGFAGLVATRIVLGAAEGPAYPVANHAIAGWFEDRRRTLPATVIALGAAAGVAVAAPLVNVVAHAWGWRWSFGVIGILGLAWCAAWSRWGKSGPDEGHLPPAEVTKIQASTATATADVQSVPLRRILLSGSFLAASFGAFATMWMLAANLTWIAKYFENVVGFSTGKTSAVIFAAGIMNGVVLIAYGAYSQRAARSGASARKLRGVLPAVAMLLAACSLTLFAIVPTPAVKVLCTLGPVAIANIILPISQAVAGQLAPAQQRGTVLGVMAFIYSFGAVLAPTVVGAMHDSAPTLAAGFREGWLTSAAVLALAGALALVFIRPERDLERIHRG